MPPCPPHSSHRPLLAQQAIPQRTGTLNSAFPDHIQVPRLRKLLLSPARDTARGTAGRWQCPRLHPGRGAVSYGFTLKSPDLRDPSSPASTCRLEFALRQNHRTPAFSGIAASKPCPVHCKRPPLPCRQLLSFNMEKLFSSSLLLQSRPVVLKVRSLAQQQQQQQPLNTR